MLEDNQMSAVERQTDGAIAILTLNNPPVNGLGAAVRTGLKTELEAAIHDDAIDGIVIKGAGRMFCAGADIREFDAVPPPGTPDLPSLLDWMEAGDKPVVAAIHGVALGGGCEVALACHYRVATADTKIGLPEVTLGILPGAGGTQRMPRLIGVSAALDLMNSGRQVPAGKAAELGAIDDVTEGDVVEAAIAAARKIAAGDIPLRRTAEIDGHKAEVDANPSVFDDFAKSIARRARGMNAPFAIIECARASVEKPFAEGREFERQEFSKLVSADEAKSMRHAFFAERECRKIPDVPKDTPKRPVQKAAIIGGGTMGGGIAMNFANAGIPVTIVETGQEALDRGLGIIEKNYANTVAKGRLGQDAMDRRMAAISGTVGLEGIADADIVIEAVFEDMDLKKKIFADLDRICKPEAILATNTSTLDVNEIAAATARPEAVVGTHFFSPANVMRLMENVRGDKTAPDVIATVMDLSGKIGKVGVLVGVCYGFVGNRMLHQYTREANFLLEEGALPQQVDKVIYDFGLPMGPFAMGDLAGLDVGWRIRKAHAHLRSNDERYSDIADKICEMGRYGQKTQGGWYDYEAGSRTPVPNAEVEALIVQTSKDRGIERREISDNEILERCMYPLINEGAKILEEGLALRASDIDVVWLHGYGFPRYRGGPMFYADTVGVDKVYDTMSRMHQEHGDLLKPAALLEQLAKDGKGFGDL